MFLQWIFACLRGCNLSQSLIHSFHKALHRKWLQEVVGGFNFKTFHGKKAGRLVAVGPVNLPVTRLYVEEIILECRQKHITKVDILGFEFEISNAEDLRLPAATLRPLRHLPKDKTVVLGLVSTKTGTLEGKDELKRRIDEAARLVPLERLCLSPQCGFSSTHHGNRLAHEDQWRKLERVIEVSKEVWR